MFNIFLRTGILYFVALFVIRAMGKAELSKLDPFQLVALFMIAELAALPIATPNVAVITGVSAMIGLLLIQVIVSVLSLKSPTFNKVVKGQASIIIDKGIINDKEMKKHRMTVDDLSQQLRIKNYPSIADIDYAILEANGDMSLIPKAAKNTPTRADIGIPTGEEIIPMVLVADGVLQAGNLKRADLNEEKLIMRLKSEGINSYKHVFLAFIDEAGLIHIHQKTPKKSRQNNINENGSGSDMQ